MKKNALVLLFVLLASLTSYGQELCANGIDDDGDGLIDLNDNDCDCNNLIDLSIIPNPSFEAHDCCPDEEGMLACATSWDQASSATSDYYNACGLDEFGFDGAVPPAMPLPGGGDGFIGLYGFLSGYREFAGACLTSPMLAGVSYSLNFQMAYSYGGLEEVDVRLYGTPMCGDLPWGGTGCPDGIGAWNLLSTTTAITGTDGEWVSVTFEFTPAITTNAIAFGLPCVDLGGLEGLYYYFDELILLETDVMGYIEEDGGWCSDDLVLTAHNDEPDGTWQWYKDGVALIGETTEVLLPIPYGEGKFTAVFTYADGCKQIDYHSPSIPVAEFTAEHVCYGEPVFFSNLSTDADTWLWDFGVDSDDTFPNDYNPTFLYDDPGLYDVELVVYSDDPSCNDTATVPVTVFSKPVPDFEITGTGVSYAGDWLACFGHELQFTDLTTIEGPVSFASWLWDFGDGTTSSDQHPTHTYDDAGEYLIALVVVSENGCSDSITNPIITNGVVAAFVSDTVCENEAIQFENLSYSTFTDIVEWKWYFGDASDTSFIENPDHLYPNDGIYNAQLFVQNEQGCQDSIIKPVLLYAIPDPDFYVDNNPTDYFNTDLRLIMIAPNPTSSYYWEMPGGAPSTSTNYGSVEVAYPEFVAAEYEVMLIEVAATGCVDTIWHTVEIMEDEMIFAPNSFTPNGDPFNQDWGVYVEGFNLDEFYLRLYNRWGELIWQTDDPSMRWDGTYGNGGLVQNGVYVWHVVARDQVNDAVFEYHGTVNVLR